MLFQFICDRYEKNAATIITSKKPFAKWAYIFAGDPVMASAALDRLLHRTPSSTSKARATGSKTHAKQVSSPHSSMPEKAAKLNITTPTTPTH